MLRGSEWISNKANVEEEEFSELSHRKKHIRKRRKFRTSEGSESKDTQYDACFSMASRKSSKSTQLNENVRSQDATAMRVMSSNDRGTEGDVLLRGAGG